MHGRGACHQRSRPQTTLQTLGAVVQTVELRDAIPVAGVRGPPALPPPSDIIVRSGAEQRRAQWPHKPKIVGSSPTPATTKHYKTTHTFRGPGNRPYPAVAHFGRAPGFHPGGSGFEPRLPVEPAAAGNPHGGRSSVRKSTGLWSRRSRVQIPSVTQKYALVAQHGQSTTLRRLGPQVRILSGAPLFHTPVAAWPDTDGGLPKHSGRHPLQESRHLEGLHSDTAHMSEPAPVPSPAARDARPKSRVRAHRGMRHPGRPPSPLVAQMDQSA